jgi:hypothetical protein
MKTQTNSIAINARIVWFCLWSLLAVGMLHAASVWADPVGTITDVSGPLVARKADGVLKALSQKSSVDAGDVLQTEAKTYARIKFIDNSEITLKPNTQLKIDDFSYDEAKPANDSSVFSLIKGGLRSITGLLGKRNKEKFKMNTPVATIGIRGTNFGALFCQSDCSSVSTPSGNTPQNGLYVDVSEGQIVVANGAGSQQFSAGQFGYVANLNSPPVILPPSEGVTLTLPSSIGSNAPDGSNPPGPGDVDCEVR